MTGMKSVALCLLVALSLSARGADDLKAYYEKQLAEILPTFVAPQLGSQVTIKMASGPSRTGILMKLSEDSMTLMTDSGHMSYQRMALQEASRAQFFAQDFAHVKALEKTRTYKGELHKDGLAAEMADIHSGTLYVTAKIDKDSDKAVEKKETENKKTGEKRENQTITRTYTEIQNLSIGVGNSTTHSDSYTVDYFFFYRTITANTSGGGGKDKKKKKPAEDDDVKEYKNVRLLNKGTQRVTVDAKRRETIKIASEPCIVEKVETSTNGHSGNRGPRVSGKESAGYLVLLKYGSEILDKKASAKSYLADEWVDKFK